MSDLFLSCLLLATAAFLAACAAVAWCQAKSDPEDDGYMRLRKGWASAIGACDWGDMQNTPGARWISFTIVSGFAVASLAAAAWFALAHIQGAAQ